MKGQPSVVFWIIEHFYCIIIFIGDKRFELIRDCSINVIEAWATCMRVMSIR